MNDESDGVAGSLRRLASEARRRQGPDAHPGPETLTAYHAGELAPAAEEEVQEHLAVCRHCVRLLLDLPAFLEGPDAGSAGLEPDGDASWQAIRARLPGPPKKAARRRESGYQPGSATGWRSGSPRRALAWLAAAALLALIAAPLWIIARQLSSPALPATVVELSSAETPRGTSKPLPTPPTTVHADAVATTFLVHLTREQPDLRFRVELRAAGGPGTGTGPAVVLSVATVVDAHTLLLVVARRQLAPGSYELRVVDPGQPSAEPLGEYPLRVVKP